MAKTPKLSLSRLRDNTTESAPAPAPAPAPASYHLPAFVAQMATRRGTWLASPWPVYAHEFAPSQRHLLPALAQVHGWKSEIVPIDTWCDRAVSPEWRELTSREDNRRYFIPAEQFPEHRDAGINAADALRPPEWLATVRPDQRGFVYKYQPGLDNTFSYAMAIRARDVASYDAAHEWARDVGHIGINNRSPTYIHGVVFEGIHYDSFSPDAASVAAMFRPMPHVERDGVKGRPRTSPRYLVNGNTPPRTPPAVRARYNKNAPDGLSDGSAFQHGYVTVFSPHSPPIVFTTYPDHAAFLSAVSVRNAPPPPPEDVVLQQWGEAVSKTVVSSYAGAKSAVEAARAALLRAVKNLALHERAFQLVSGDTYDLMTKTCADLRAMGEIESVTISPEAITIITKPMLAYRMRDGDERYCGKFEIQIDLRGAVRVRNIASPASGYRNPHGWCVGSFGGVFANALAAFDYYALILAIMEYYRTFDANHEDAWGTLPNSRSTPKKVFVSDWHTLVGKWGVPTKKTPDNVTKVGEVIRTYGFAPSQQPDAPDAPESDGTTDGAYDSNVAVLRPTAARKR